MRLLLDTHVLLWWLADIEISEEAFQAIADPENEVHVSPVSTWEIAIKAALGKLKAPQNLLEGIAVNGFEPLTIKLAHGLEAGVLPPHHRDPFDRMLIAQARLDELTLVTRDARFADYGVRYIAA